MSLIVDTVSAYLPSKRKQTPSGWISFNAVCCHNNGENKDNKQRGGVYIADNNISYHCFNCGFKASWQPGWQITQKFKKLLSWLDVPDELITKCSFESLRLKNEEYPENNIELLPKFFDRALPLGSKLIKEWIQELPSEPLLSAIQYLTDRGYDLDDYDWYWTDEKGFDDRLIVPFYYQNRIVGWTARLCKDRKLAKYISEQQPGYVFNLDNQTNDRNYTILTEGPLDAICIDGIAVMSNEISAQQQFLISKLQKEIIVVPDRDQAGSKLVRQAIDIGWSVSFPDWEPHIKDINDAYKYYGKLYTLWSILEHKESNKLKIEFYLRTKKCFGIK